MGRVKESEGELFAAEQESFAGVCCLVCGTMADIDKPVAPNLIDLLFRRSTVLQDYGMYLHKLAELK